MYRLTHTIATDLELNRMPEVSFNPAGTLFAVTLHRSSEVAIHDVHTRGTVRVYGNPEAALDGPHGVLLTDRHLVVANTHGILRPSSFTVYRLDDVAGTPVSRRETPFQHFREAHSLALRDGVLVVSYCQNTRGPGALVSYRFDDERGVIGDVICVREAPFTELGEPKGVAFDKDGRHVFCSYVTSAPMRGAGNNTRRLRIARDMWRKRGTFALLRHLARKSAGVLMRRPARVLGNGIAIFAIDAGGEFSAVPGSVLAREHYCRLENIGVAGATMVLTDTINARVELYDLASDPKLEKPVQTITGDLTLPHGAKLSPDRNLLVVSNYGLKVADRQIHWGTQAPGVRDTLFIYERDAMAAGC